MATADVWRHLAGELEIIERRLTKEMKSETDAEALTASLRGVAIIMKITVVKLDNTEMLLSILADVESGLKGLFGRRVSEAILASGLSSTSMACSHYCF